MAEQKHYRILAADGLVVTDDQGKEHLLKPGRVVPRSAFGGTITWLLDDKLVEEAEPTDSEQPAANPQATGAPPPTERAVSSAPPVSDQPEQEGGSG